MTRLTHWDASCQGVFSDTTDQPRVLLSSATLGFFVVRWRFFSPRHTGVGDMVMATVRKGKPELRKKGEPPLL